ncbi:MAG: hypothetical protein ACKV22_11885 [Bryobacteraceae bacterium]
MILEKRPYRSIAAHFGISHVAVYRHKTQSPSRFLHPRLQSADCARIPMRGERWSPAFRPGLGALKRAAA